MLFLDGRADGRQQFFRMLENVLDLVDTLGKVETVSDPFIQGDAEFAEFPDYFTAVGVDDLFGGDLADGGQG